MPTKAAPKKTAKAAPKKAAKAPAKKTESTKRPESKSVSAAAGQAKASVSGGSSTAEAWPDGFCETAEGAALYRRGFPHLRWLTDEIVDDPAELAAKALMAVEPVLDYAWPRAVAERVVRGYLAIGDKYGAASPADPSVAAAVQREGTIGDPGEIFDIALRRDRASRDSAVEDFVFLVEAFAGSDAVCDAIVRALEADPAILQRRGDALAIGRSLGFVMLRADGRDAFAARVAAVRDRAVEQKAAPTKFWSALLATLVDGDAAFEGFGHALKYYVFVRDRARLVQKLLTAPGEFLPDMRFAYLGGPAILDLYAKRLDELPKGALARRFFEELKYLERPLAEPLMRRLAARPDVGARAKAWLEQS